jgi:flavin reductase
MDARFANADWSSITSGEAALPALRHAIASFACELTDLHRVGTHNVMVGKVSDIRQRADGDALLYFERGYVQLPQAGR